MNWRALAVALFVAGAASAQQDSIESEGPLDDERFYRLAACGAPPGGECRGPFVRWRPRDAGDLTVSIQRIAPGFPAERRARISAALDDAIAAINAAAAGVALRRVDDLSDAHVTVFLEAVQDGGRIDGTGLSPLDGMEIGAAHVQVWWNAERELTRGVIVFAEDIQLNDIPGIALEELFQSLGLLYDVRSPWYETRSILSEDGNFLTRLGSQDVSALRRHYPPRD